MMRAATSIPSRPPSHHEHLELLPRHHQRSITSYLANSTDHRHPTAISNNPSQTNLNVN